MAPTSRSRAAQPSRRVPMPGRERIVDGRMAQRAGDADAERRRRPSRRRKPRTPTTASSFSSASVVAGLSRSTRPGADAERGQPGRALTSTFSPTAAPVRAQSRPDAAVLAAGNRLVQAELAAPEGLVSERVAAEDGRPRLISASGYVERARSSGGSSGALETPRRQFGASRGDGEEKIRSATVRYHPVLETKLACARFPR